MKPVNLGTFRGINNILPLDRHRNMGDREAGTYVHDAVDVDLSAAGTFQRRAGRTRVGELTRVRALTEFNGYGYLAAEDRIYRFTDPETPTEIGTVSSPFAPVSMAITPLGLVISDATRLQLVVGDTMQPLAPPAVNPLPTVTAGAGGVLRGAQYQLVFAHVSAAERRGPVSAPVYVTVADGGAVTVSTAARPFALAVFMTAGDGEILYRVGSLAPAQTSAVFAANMADGEPLVYRPSYLMPAGEHLAFGRGRLLSAIDKMIYVSDPFDLGVADAFNYIMLADPIAVLAPANDGIFVATTKETFFLAGKDHIKSELNQIAPFGAVPGSLTRDVEADEWMWFTPRGPVRTKGTGIDLLQNDVIAYEQAQAGASIIREQDGVRALITALTGTIPAGAAVVGSYMDVEIITGE